MDPDANRQLYLVFRRKAAAQRRHLLDDPEGSADCAFGSSSCTSGQPK